MGQQIPNSFTSYDLTDEEVAQGSIFTGLQKQVLQNHLSTEATLRLQLDYDPNDPQRFLQAEAEAKAKIQLLQYLLACSDTFEEALKQVNTN